MVTTVARCDGAAVKLARQSAAVGLYGLAAILAAMGLAGCAAPLATGLAEAPAAAVAVAATDSAEAAPQHSACPPAVPSGTRCHRGQDSQGAFYLLAVPADWNGVLVVHAHGGPSLGPPQARRLDEDIDRWRVVLQAGYAWAASTYRQGGVAVTAAAQDTERARRIFVDHVARPRRTVLHGQSWGASVAAKAAELYASPDAAATRGASSSPYDAVLLTSGVLGGGSRSYDFRLDLRVVYQHLCGNHPQADEAPYPLWMGLPPGNPLTRAQLAQRVDDCLGVRQPVSQRSPEQSRRLKTLVDVIRIPPASVLSHLEWATWHFQDIVQYRTGGRSPLGNVGVRYTGSADDDALNAQVPRYAADPQAVAQFSADTDLSGRIGVPVLTLHAVNDPTAFVELEASFRDTMDRAGQGARLVQVFTSDSTHNYLTDPIYPAALDALLAWAADGHDRPTPQSLAARCLDTEVRFGRGCHVLPDYQPAPLATRVPARH